MNAPNVIKETSNKMSKCVDFVLHEFSTIHTGKASPSMVEGVVVEAYGSRMKLKETASISTPDHKSIVIQPWDKSIAKEIEKAIRDANIGLNPQSDSGLIRCPIPELTGERREQLFKVCKEMAEEGRKRVRGERRDGLEILKSAQKKSLISEDDLKRYEKEIQQLTDKFIEQIDQQLGVKEKELKTV